MLRNLICCLTHQLKFWFKKIFIFTLIVWMSVFYIFFLSLGLALKHRLAWALLSGAYWPWTKFSTRSFPSSRITEHSPCLSEFKILNNFSWLNNCNWTTFLNHKLQCKDKALCSYKTNDIQWGFVCWLGFVKLTQMTVTWKKWLTSVEALPPADWPVVLSWLLNCVKGTCVLQVGLSLCRLAWAV